MQHRVDDRDELNRPAGLTPLRMTGLWLVRPGKSRVLAEFGDSFIRVPFMFLVVKILIFKAHLSNLSGIMRRADSMLHLGCDIVKGI